MSNRLGWCSLSLVVLLGLASTDCLRRGRYWRARPVARALIGAAILSAAILGTAAVMAAHDAHLHSENCGHHRRFHSGRWVYYYNNHWEYHDGNQWYSYAASPPPETAPPPGSPPAGEY